MDLILTFIVAVMLYCILDAVFRAYTTVRQERKDAVVNYLNSIIHKVNVEKYHDIEYWFDENTNKFLAQGKNHEEISKILKCRFPDHVFLFDEGGFSEKTNWTFIPFDNNNPSTFINKLIYGRAQ